MSENKKEKRFTCFLKKGLKRMAFILGGLFFLIFLILLVSSLIIQQDTQNQIYPIDQVPSAPVAVVFGAGLRRDGEPTLVLRDRLNQAIQLYKNGQVSKILVSGDNRFVDYNEPGSMYTYIISTGVPAKDVVRDYAGRRTYDTCYRAKAIFGVMDAILVTQAYHMPRALYLCNHLGLKAYGVTSDLSSYTRFSYANWTIREWVARTGALWDIWVSRPLPVLGDPEPIIIDKSIKSSS
jgi:SanA protein